MSSGVVTFDYASWVERYPEFASVSSTLAQLYFNEATLYCDNTTCSPVQDLTQRGLFLNMLTAHIAALYGSGSGPNGMVGRVASASEGSVSVQSQVEGNIANRSWYAQTPYGFSYWQASAVYRMAIYKRGRRHISDPWAHMMGRR